MLSRPPTEDKGEQDKGEQDNNDLTLLPKEMFIHQTDLGSDLEPHNLEQFAVMGDIYFRAMFGNMFGKRSGTPGPRVGLLSIGEEEAKGNQLTRESFQLLKQLPLNFIGNVEGRD